MLTAPVGCVVALPNAFIHQNLMRYAGASASYKIDMAITAIELPMEEVAEFCHKWQITEFALFGSVVRDDFRPDSDIDVMVQFHPDAHPTFGTLDQMEAELKTIFHREIDLITRQGIEASRNYLRRHEILSSVQVVYATGSSVPA